MHIRKLQTTGLRIAYSVFVIIHIVNIRRVCGESPTSIRVKILTDHK